MVQLVRHRQSGLAPYLAHRYVIKFATFFKDWAIHLVDVLDDAGCLNVAMKEASSGAFDTSEPSRCKKATKIVTDLTAPVLKGETESTFVRRLRVKMRQLGMSSYLHGYVCGAEVLGEFIYAPLLSSFYPTVVGCEVVGEPWELNTQPLELEEKIRELEGKLTSSLLKSIQEVMRDSIFLRKSNSQKFRKEITRDYDGFELLSEATVDALLFFSLNLGYFDKFIGAGVQRVRWIYSKAYQHNRDHYKNELQGYITLGDKFESEEMFPSQSCIGCRCLLIPDVVKNFN